MAFLLTIHHEDDLLTTIDRVLTAADDDVIIVIPQGARLLSNEENFELLKREAEAGGKRISIRTNDPRGKALAVKLGIPLAAQTLSSSKRRIFSDIRPPGSVQSPVLPGTPKEASGQAGQSLSPTRGEEAKPVTRVVKRRASLPAEPSDVEAVPVTVTGSKPGDRTEIIGAARAVDGEEELVAGDAPRQDSGQAPLQPPFAQGHGRAQQGSEGQAGQRPVPSGTGQGALPLPDIEEEPLPFLRPQAQSTRPRRGIPKFTLPKFTLPNISLTGVTGGRLGVLLIVVAGIGVAFLVANEVLPHAEIRIKPKSEMVTFSMPVTVVVGDTGVLGDPSERSVISDVAGQRISVSATEERSISASGETEVTRRAGGTITIRNAFSSDSQTLVATTRFVSQDGKLFRLDKTIVVPGAKVVDGDIVPSTITATVTADEPGPKYNIGSSTFSIPGFQGSPKFNKFTATSSEPMSGGAKGKVTVVTEEDVAAAREGIEEQVIEELKRAFKAQVVDGLVVPQDGRSIKTTVTIDKEAGDVADAVTVLAQGSLSAIAYDAKDLTAVVLTALTERISSEADLVEGSATIVPTVVMVDIESGTLSLDVEIDARSAWRVDVALVQEAVAGQSETEIRSWLSDYEAVDHARAFFWPFWVKTAPENPERIKVIVGLDAV